MVAGMPESFNVLVKEIRSLALNMELEELTDADRDSEPIARHSALPDSDPHLTTRISTPISEKP